MATTIPTYRYQYRQPSSSTYLPSSRFSLTPPRNTLPHTYLESSTNIFASFQDKIIIRQVGGPGDNHVQWVSVSDIVPYHPDLDNHGNRQPIHEEPLSASPATNSNQNRVHAHHHQREPISLISNNKNDNENGTHDNNNRKRRLPRSDLNKNLECGMSRVHGVVHTANWTNDVGDRLWLRSDQPIIRGRRSVPVVNLDKGVSAEVCINHVTWYPSKQNLTSDTVITFIGAEYRHHRGSSGEPFRMCIIQDHGTYDCGIIDMISLEELRTCFEDVEHEPVSTTNSKQIALPHKVQGPRGQRPQGPRPMPTSSSAMDQGSNLINRPAIFGELGESSDNDENLSQAFFTSSMSTKSKLALDLVVQSLSIFNFNAAMLDLAALSNQSNQVMGGLIRDVDERPEASEDDSDEEDDNGEGGREEKVWSDCESIYSSPERSIMSGKDQDENERS